MINSLSDYLRSVWSSTHYDSPELTRFAEKKAVEEASRGLAAMSLLTIAILLIETTLFFKFNMDPNYLYTCAILVVLSLNTLMSSRAIVDPQALHLLGVTLLVVSGTAFILLAHYQQEFHPMLFASVALLFMVVPMMPWGLREAMTVNLLIYSMFTFSTLGANFDFAEQSLWTLQFIMVGTGLVSLSLVVRNVSVRKHDLATQYELVVAHDRIAELSNRDPLTAAWNRRYFDAGFLAYLEQCRRNRNQINFMLIDIDDFKLINDNCGHENGDRILQCVATAFDELITDNGTLVRMGGDEFAVVFADLDPEVIARRGLHKLRELASDTKYAELAEVGLSFGVASVPSEISISYRQFYKQADLALYKAKGNKGADSSVPNIVVSRLHYSRDIEDSTQSLWSTPEAGAGRPGESFA